MTVETPTGQPEQRDPPGRQPASGPVGTRAAADGKRIAVRIARVVTEALAPAGLVATLLVLLGWHSEAYQPKGFVLGVVAGTFESVLPFAYIVREVRAGRLTDHHIELRHQRLRPLMVAFGSVVAGLVILLVAGAARELVAGVVAGGVGLVVAGIVSHWWKMSIHAAVAAGACVILTQVFGPVGLLAIPLVGAVGWSRVVLRAHTAAQVVVGFAVGAVVAGTVFGFVR